MEGHESIDQIKFLTKEKNMNPWHDIEVGNDCPKMVTVIIEIPQFSKAKFELIGDN